METKVKQLHTNVNGTDKKKSSKNTELVKRDSIKDTPFEIITIEGKSFGAMGDYRITEEKKTAKEVEKELSKITWNRIIQIIMILDEVKNRNINEKTKNK
jgi:hypothetical protein